MSTAPESFSELFSLAEQDEDYWTELAIIEFTEELSRLMELRGMSRADLAAAIGSSSPYITKVLKGNVNFTLATMTKLARALGGVVRIHIAPAGTRTEWEDFAMAGTEAPAAVEMAPNPSRERAQPAPKRRKAPSGSRPLHPRAPEGHR